MSNINMYLLLFMEILEERNVQRNKKECCISPVNKYLFYKIIKICNYCRPFQTAALLRSLIERCQDVALSSSGTPRAFPQSVKTWVKTRGVPLSCVVVLMNQENITILTVVHSLELLQYLTDFAFKINPNHMT